MTPAEKAGLVNIIRQEAPARTPTTQLDSWLDKAPSLRRFLSLTMLTLAALTGCSPGSTTSQASVSSATTSSPSSSALPSLSSPRADAGSSSHVEPGSQNSAVSRTLSKIENFIHKQPEGVDIVQEFTLAAELAKHGKPAIPQIREFRNRWSARQREIKNEVDARYRFQEVYAFDFPEFHQARSCVSVADHAMQTIAAGK